jgi:hypothetical protein
VKKSHTLSFKDDYSFHLIGISSHENDYRLSWAINNQMGTSFTRCNNLVTFNSRIKQDQEFSLSRYTDEETYIQYHLISNRCDNGFLLEEMTNIDFVILISGELSGEDIADFVENLRKIEMITAAFVIDVEGLKSRKRLLF